MHPLADVRRVRSLQILILLVAPLLAFAPALQARFIFDDDAHLLANTVLRARTPLEFLKRAWLSTNQIVYYPVTWTSYWVEHQLFGLQPLVFHLTNILLHTVSAFLLWRCLRQVSFPRSKDINPQQQSNLAWLVALLFAVHPVTVNTVAWVTQRKNVLCLLFFLVAISVFLQWRATRRWPWYVATLLAFVCAMWSKGAAAPLPAVLWLLSWWLDGGKFSWRQVRELAPIAALGIVLVGVEIWFQEFRAIGPDAIPNDPFLLRIVRCGWMVWFYVSKALLPIGLSFNYRHWWIDVRQWYVYLPLALLIAAGGALWFMRRRFGNGPLVASTYFILCVAPALGIARFYFIVFAPVGDQYQYLALPGLIALVVGSGAFLLNGASRWTARVGASAAVLAVAMCVLLSHRHTRRFADDEVLWRVTLQENPQAYAGYNRLGVLRLEAGRFSDAVVLFSRSVVVNPGNAEDWFNLGSAVINMHDYARAERIFRHGLSLAPGDHRGWFDLGMLYVQQNDVAAAAPYFAKAIELMPPQRLVVLDVARSLRQMDRHADAEMIEKVCILPP